MQTSSVGQQVAATNRLHRTLPRLVPTTSTTGSPATSNNTRPITPRNAGSDTETQCTKNNIVHHYAAADKMITDKSQTAHRDYLQKVLPSSPRHWVSNCIQPKLLHSPPKVQNIDFNIWHLWPYNATLSKIVASQGTFSVKMCTIISQLTDTAAWINYSINWLAVLFLICMYTVALCQLCNKDAYDMMSILYLASECAVWCDGSVSTYVTWHLRE